MAFVLCVKFQLIIFTKKIALIHQMMRHEINVTSGERSIVYAT